jgi:DNA-directed RNA polymerase subunit M/transcription elongation factor TFIIS
MPYTAEPKLDLQVPCRKCGQHTVSVQPWDSSDEAFTDYHYTCECGHGWWCEGADA